MYANLDGKSSNGDIVSIYRKTKTPTVSACFSLQDGVQFKKTKKRRKPSWRSRQESQGPETVRIHVPAMEGRAGVAAFQQSERTSQAYLQTPMGRMYLFYTSVAAGKMRARPGITAELCSAREALGNLLNRQSVIALAVDEVIVPAVLLEMRFGGKPAKAGSLCAGKVRPPRQPFLRPGLP